MSEHNLQVLAAFDYDVPTVEKGYTGQTLYVNVDSGEIQAKPVTEDMKEKFVGGRGFDLWLLWHGVEDDTDWDDPKNEIVIASGPCGGTTQYPGSGKSIAVAISPLTHIPIDSNAGGHFGPYLKFAGWDAIEVQGKAADEVIVYIDGPAGRVQVLAAPEDCPTDTHMLGHWMMDHFAASDKDKRQLSFVSAGRGSDHTLMGCLNFSLYDRRRQDLRYKQAGRGGIGTVLRDKKIKAVIVKSPPVRGDSNHPAEIGRIAETGAEMQREVATYDDQQNRMHHSGTSYLVEIMNDYDLLPVHNFKFGRHPKAEQIKREVWEERYTQGIPDGCWYGCTVACAHAVDGYEVRTGPYKGQTVIVDGPEYETIAGCGSNCGIFEPWYLLEVNFYCDTYGIDTISFGTGMAFVMECYEAGILDKEKTGGLELTFGNAEDAIEVLHLMARGEGFGLIFGQGSRKMKDYFVEHFGADRDFVEDIAMEAKGLEYSEYMTKESLAQQGGYGLTNKGPQHDEAWLIFMDMVNNELPTFEDKAEALHYFPMWRTWFGLCGFCKLPWNDVVHPKNKTADEPQKIPHHVENYRQIFMGVTGKEIATEDLITQSEQVYNFQRVFNIRLGKGLRANDAIPYRSVGPVTEEEYESRQERYDKQLREWLDLDPEEMTLEEKMAAHREYRTQQYEHLIDAVYKRRGWTSNGVPTPEKLASLGVDYPEVLAVVEKYL